MNRTLREAFHNEMNIAKGLYAENNLKSAFTHLERAHILGQSYIITHTLSHWWMLKVGLRRRSIREIIGQAFRIIASLLISRIWVPRGNTGGVDVSPIKPMPIPADLGAILKQSRSTAARLKYIALTVGGLLSAGLVIFGLFLFIKQSNGQKQVEQELRNYKNQQVLFAGSVKSLSILPLVNWHTQKIPGKDLRGELGVSYLIKTESNTILFDLAQNTKSESPSPLEHNMLQLGINPAEIDTIFISHAHFDHVGGRKWSKARTFSLGNVQKKLPGKTVYSPVPMTYPGLKPEHTPRPRVLLPGIATTGTIPRQLFIGRIDEQALVINVEGKGLVLIVGCGHQTQEKIIQRVENTFQQKIYGIIGDLHYPVPNGRLKVLGLNGQRLFASGKGPFTPLEAEDVETDIKRLKKRKPGIVALGGHDSSDQVIAQFAKTFESRYRHVRVGEWIKVQ